MARRPSFSTRFLPFAGRKTVRKPVRRHAVRKPSRLQLERLEEREMLAADVTTDQADYFPGQTAYILASDFAIGETIEFQVLHIDGTPNTGNGHVPWQVTDGVTGDYNGDGILDGDLDGVADGSIRTSWFVDPDDSAGSTFELTAQGLSSGSLATTVFTDDGNDSPTNILGDPNWLDVSGVNPVTTITAPAGFVISKIAIKSGNGAFGVPEPDNVDPGDDNTGDQHSGVIYADSTYGTGNGFTVVGIGTGTVTVTKNAGTKDISHVDYMLQESVGSAPAIDIEKFVNGDDADSPTGPVLIVGSTATFTYVVTNTGNVPLSNVVVVDDNGTPGNTADDFNPMFIDGDTNNNNLLDLTETWTYTASRIVTAGQYTNIGKVTGQGAGQMVMDTDPANHFGVVRGIDIEKHVNGQDADSPTGPVLMVGSTATFTYFVTNTGNVPISNVVVVDDNGTPGNTADDFNPMFTGGDTNSDNLLDVTETWTYTASRIVTAGQYTNIGKVTGEAAGEMVMDSDPANHFGKCEPIIVIGPDKGNKSAPIVKLVNKNSGAVIREFYVYEPNFMGGVRIATGDLDGDGIEEIIVAPGQGRVGEVRVFTQNGVELTQFRTIAYGTSYKKGVEVAVGDVNGDGKNDIVTTNSQGRTEVRVFYNNHPSLDPIPNSPNVQFFVFPSNFKGGADVVVADMGTFLNGATISATALDNKAEIIVGSGPGLRSTIYVYDVTGAPAIVDTILPLSNTFKGGITLSTARVNADLIPEIIVAAGNGGGSIVEVWDGLTNDAVDVKLAAFAAFGNVATKNMPVHATALDTNGDGIADILAVVQGTNGKANQIRCFLPNGTPTGTPHPFVGPWNIASLHGVDCSLPDGPATTAVTDQIFAQLGSQPEKTSKKVKKPKKARGR
jgi:hypothetical protein